MKVTILGCGTSGGVPRVGPNWGRCDPTEPKNRRRRGSILVEQGGTRLLVDTSPDLRMQLLDTGVDDIDAVVWTHEHADQTHGIDELRVIAVDRRKRIPAWADARTLENLRRRFGYCFERPAGSPYPPIFEAKEIRGPFDVGSVSVLPFDQDHGSTTSLGFRFGNIAYSNDVVALSDAAFEILGGVRVWIVDAMRHEPHPTHAHVDLALEWIGRVRPARAVLTNLHHTLDYNQLKAMLPAGVEPAFDGLEIEV